MFTIGAAAVIALAAAVSCTDLNRMQEELDGLENRVEVLEKVLPALNGNIEAIRTLAEGVTINKVEDKEGVYTLTLSNGEQLVLTQGSIGVGKTPVMSVDKDGYWMVDYQDGKGAVPVLADGQKVKATGKDGVTPKFSTDKDGYWTVSYDGKTYEQVKDVDGRPVKALADGTAGDPFFKEVKFEGEEFTVTMQNGEVLRLPVVSGFLCAIKGAEKLQEFAPGETKVYAVEMKGVASTVVTTPRGWTAVLTADKLSITAPGKAPVTKTAIADSRTDVSILAISVQGLSAVAKVRVTGGGVPAEPEIPVEPVVGNDLYQAYADGLEIDVCGRKYSKAVNGDAVLLTAETALTELKPTIASRSAVVFLETPKGTSFTIGSYTNIEGDVALIGRHADQQAVLAPQFAFKLMSGSLAMRNLVIDQSSFDAGNKYLLYNAKPKNSDKHFGGLYFENCRHAGMVKPVLYLSEPSCGIGEIAVRDCAFEISENADQKFQLFNLYKTTELSAFRRIVFDNNLVYCRKGVKWLQLFSYAQTVAQSPATWNTEISISNNTLYNVPGGNGYLKFYQVARLKVNRNLLYADPTFSGCASSNVILYSEGQTGNGIDLSGNIAYGLAEGKNWLCAHSNSKYVPEHNFIDKLPETPFQQADPETGTFVVKAEYAAYGVQPVK